MTIPLICPLCFSELNENNFCNLCKIETNADFPFEITIQNLKLNQFIAGDKNGFYAIEVSENTPRLAWVTQNFLSEIPEDFVKPLVTGKSENYNYAIWELPKNNILHLKKTDFQTIRKLSDWFVNLKKKYPEYEVFPFEVIFDGTAWKLLSARINDTYKTPVFRAVISYERFAGFNFTSKSATYELASLIYLLFTKKYPMGTNFPVSKNTENINLQDKVVLEGLMPSHKDRPDFKTFVSNLKKAFSPENPTSRLLRYAWSVAGLLSLTVLGYGLVYVLLKFG